MCTDNIQILRQEASVMKLFSFGKEKKQESFEFQIDDAFALKESGVVVAGRVTKH